MTREGRFEPSRRPQRAELKAAARLLSTNVCRSAGGNKEARTAVQSTCLFLLSVDGAYAWQGIVLVKNISKMPVALRASQQSFTAPPARFDFGGRCSEYSMHAGGTSLAKLIISRRSRKKNIKKCNMPTLTKMFYLHTSNAALPSSLLRVPHLT